MVTITCGITVLILSLFTLSLHCMYGLDCYSVYRAGAHYVNFVRDCVMTYNIVNASITCCMCATPQHITDPHNEEQSMDVTFNNPLSQDEEVICMCQQCKYMCSEIFGIKKYIATSMKF